MSHDYEVERAQRVEREKVTLMKLLRIGQLIAGELDGAESEDWVWQRVKPDDVNVHILNSKTGARITLTRKMYYDDKAPINCWVTWPRDSMNHEHGPQRDWSSYTNRKRDDNKFNRKASFDREPEALAKYFLKQVVMPYLEEYKLACEAVEESNAKTNSARQHAALLHKALNMDRELDVEHVPIRLWAPHMQKPRIDVEVWDEEVKLTMTLKTTEAALEVINLLKARAVFGEV